MDWAKTRTDQNMAYEESLLQDIMKKIITIDEDVEIITIDDDVPDKKLTDDDVPDKKLTLSELREKRIQAFTQTSAKKT